MTAGEYTHDTPIRRLAKSLIQKQHLPKLSDLHRNGGFYQSDEFRRHLGR